MDWFKKHKKENILLLATVLVLLGIVLMFFTLRNLSIAKSKEYLYKAKMSNSYKESLINIEIANLLNPSEETMSALVSKLLDGGDYELVEQYLRGNNSEIAQKSLAKAKYALGKFAEAETLSVKYLSDTECFDLYAKSLLKEGKIAEVRALSGNSGSENIYKLIVLVDANETNTGTARVASILTGEGYPQSSFAILEEAATSGTMDRDAYFMLGDSYYASGKVEQAYAAYIEAQRKDQYYPQVYQQLVKTAKDLGKVVEAEGYQSQLDKLVW